MKRNDIKNEISGVLDYFVYEYCLSKDEAKMPTAEMYIYLYLNGGIETNELVEILDEIRDDKVLN